MEDAVELLRPLRLRRVSGAPDDRQRRAADQGLRALGVRKRKERVVRAPDQLDGDLQLVQAAGHVVVPAEKRARVDKRANRREICAAVAIDRIHLAQIGEVTVVEGLRQVGAGARVSGGEPPHHRLRRPGESVARKTHDRLAHTRDEDDRRALPAVHVMHAQRADVDEAGTHQLRLSFGTDHWPGSIRTGLASPAILEPLLKVDVMDALMTVTAPGPFANHAVSSHTAALRSSMPSSVTSGSSRLADSIHRWPKVSKCGSTAVSGTIPSASLGRRSNRFGQPARISVWLHSAIAPADEPARTAPSCQAAKMALQTRESRSTCATRPGSPPTR